MKHTNPWGRVFIEAIDEELARQGRGSISRMEEALGVEGQGWWQARRRRQDLYVSWAIEVLDHLGLDPVRFFRKIVGKVDRLELDRPLGEPPEIVVRAWQHFRSTTPLVEGVNEDTLKTLDTLRYEKPQDVVDQALVLVDYCPRPLLPRLLGVTGSAWRLLVELDQAEHAIYAAIQMSRELEDPELKGELLQRLAYVLVERSQWHEALRLSEQAALLFLRGGSRVRLGKSLVDQGLWLFYLKRHEEAIGTHKRGLEYLPVEERHYRTAALVSIGLNHRALRRPQAAVEFVERAEAEAIGLPRMEQARVWWLRGNLCADFGSLDEAGRLLSEVVEVMARVHLGEMALAVCDQLRVYLLQEDRSAAYEAATRLRWLLEPMRKHGVISQLIADLLGEGEKALTIALARHTKEALEGELAHRPVWRQLWVRGPRL